MLVLNKLTNLIVSPCLCLVLASLPALSISSDSTNLSGSVSKTHHAHPHSLKTAKTSTYFQRHPKVKSAAIGAGIGAVAGGATGLISGRGVMRGAAIGAGSGAGVGLIHSSQTMKRHPLIKDTLEGTTAGLGIGMAAGRHHGASKGAALGAAAGLGVGLFKHFEK